MPTSSEIAADSNTRERVQEILSGGYEDYVYDVSDGEVWVSGMNQDSKKIARDMARTLVRQDIPASLVYSDSAAEYGGFVFRYGQHA